LDHHRERVREVLARDLELGALATDPAWGSPPIFLSRESSLGDRLNVGVRFIFLPCAADRRDDGARQRFVQVGVLGHIVVDVNVAILGNIGVSDSIGVGITITV
jgi:hypothetical protein